MAINGRWSIYAKKAAFAYVTAHTATAAPTALWGALYSDSASPDGGTSTELTVAGYARLSAAFTVDTSGLSMSNTSDINFSGISTSTIGGVAICDASTAGHVYYWWNLAAITPAPSGLLVPAGQLVIAMIDAT